MKQNTPIMTRCHACDAAMDVTTQPPFAKVICPRCGTVNRVKCEFGPYTLKRRHAIGGMSMVFAAEDATLGREVALKILSEEYSADERRIAAFEHEARLTAALSHPHVVRLFTTGRAFGRFYIAMEMVPSGHLEQLIIDRGKIAESELLPLAIEVAQGLKAAHAAGLIHRDVKPGNILLDADGHAKLVDFGLALVTHGGPARPAEMWATPYYAPPETIAGLPEDFRADIYAFGATLYHALSGHPSCPKDSLVSDELATAKKQVRPLGEVSPEISAATCRLVDRAMAYSPEDRHGSYDELIAELSAALSELKSGRAESAGDHARRQLKQRRIRRHATAGVGSTVLCLCGWLLWHAATSSQTRTQAAKAPAATAARIQPAVTAARPAEIGSRHRQAHEAIRRHDFRRAEQEFLNLHRNPEVLEPTRSWVGIEAMLAAWLDGRDSDARQFAGKLLTHLRALPKDHPLGNGYWAALLQRTADGSELAPPKGEHSAQLLMQAMLAGLGDWQLGRMDQAAACFKLAASIQLPADDQWPAVYQQVATDYLADHAVLTDPMFSVQPEDSDGCLRLAASLTEKADRMQTKGQARELVMARVSELQRLAIEMAENHRISATATEQPAVIDPHARLEEFTRDWRFAEAAVWLRALPEDPPGASRIALAIMCESAAAFVADITGEIARSPFTGELTLKTGESARQLSLGSRGGLMVTTSNGAVRRMDWTDLTAEALINVHRERVKLVIDDQDRQTRHERAIAFDWLVGQRSRAMAAASKLAESSPAFKERWGFIAAGLPQ